MSNDEEFCRGKLFAASWRGEFDQVREVIEDGGLNVNVVDSDGVSALRQVDSMFWSHFAYGRPLSVASHICSYINVRESKMTCRLAIEALFHPVVSRSNDKGPHFESQ